MIDIKRVIFTILCVFCLNTISASASDTAEFIPYINSCSTIRQYDSNKENVYPLVLDVLNNHHHFRDMSSLTPSSTKTGALKMCDAKFIDDIMYKTFRITTPRPTPDKLKELGYYYNNGFYYYKDNTPSHSVKVNGITRTIPLDDGGIYVIFTNTLTANEDSPVTENSAIKFHRDSSGWYVTAIHMGLDFSSLSEHLKTPEPSQPYAEFIWDMLPALVFFLTITVAIIMLYKFVLF